MTSGKLTIREFDRSLTQHIIKLHNASSEFFEQREVSGEFIREIAKRNDFQLFVLAEEEDIIGFVGFLFQPVVGRAEVGPICVKADLRKKGLGTLLLNHALASLREKKMHRVIAKIKAENKTALSFFKGNGFVEEGYFKKYTVEGDDVVQLRKFI